ncbi:5-formyltetrahydrofolate cyclo-ligase [Saccharata proteae CBS 121410]|uniref:5-formyltetrahydrofolate cyclo-ligase n=1 Tax=Saccharata proteae CBS 121410 TaxID=1314787 RepID=A0A9P4I331_9PEZI|nr:5-formyltetrahydrofolate cyclo-ligase [Saccharata proteae CBS 121410]
MSSPMKTAKRGLRQRVKQVLSGLSPDAVAHQSSRATQALVSMPEYRAAKRISVYLSMPSGEISTASIVQDALNAGKKVFIPYTYQASEQSAGQPKSIMDMVELRSTTDLESMQPDKWRIPTPSSESVSERLNSFGSKGLSQGRNLHQESTNSGLDLIVVPGMAFDTDFGRLGHGKGFYDFFLDRCRQQSEQDTCARMPFLVGLTLNEQLLESNQPVPMDSTDWRLNALATGNGEVLRPGKSTV